jgi:hypothetical protein
VRSSLIVGGIEVALQVPAGPLEDIVIERYSPFLGAVVDPVCQVKLAPIGREKGEDNPPLAVLGGVGTSEISFEHPDFHGSVDLEGSGSLVTAGNPFTIDHFFRLLFALLAPRHDAVMLHSCGIITGGQAHVFAGESGAGKSTLASLAGHRPLMSDEHVLIRQTKHDWLAASTPFWGSYAKPGPARQAPMARLWSLTQAPEHRLVARDAQHTLLVAVGNAVLPSPDPAIKEAVFDVAVRLAADVPSGELHFTVDPSIWEEIDAGIAVA